MMLNLVAWNSDTFTLITCDWFMRADLTMVFSVDNMIIFSATSWAIYKSNLTLLLDVLFELVKRNLRFFTAVWTPENS